MGRLQRKKPASKKKKKVKNGEDIVSAQPGNAATEKKTLSLASFSRDVKKGPIFKKMALTLSKNLSKLLIY